MSCERHATLTGLLLLLAGLLSGCGSGSGGTNQSAPVASDRPDGGLEASKRIMDMQPPPPTRRGR